MKYEILMHILPGPLYESEEIEINGRKDRSIDRSFLYLLFVYSIESHTLFSPIAQS